MLKQARFILAQKHHAEHYLNMLAELNAQYVAGGNGALQAIHKFRDLLPQMNHARLWALTNLDENDRTTYSVQFFDVGQQIIGVCLSMPQLLTWSNDALATTDTEKSPWEHMNMSIITGKCYFFLHDFEQGMVLLEQGLALAQEFEADFQIVEASNMLGVAYIFQGDSRGVAYSEEALRVAETLDDEALFIKALGNLGVVYRRVNRYADAAQCMERTLALSIEKEDWRGQAIDLVNLGELYLVTAELDKAAEYLERGLVIDEQLGNQHGINVKNLNLGLVYTRQKNYPAAYQHLQAARVYYQEVEDDASLGTTYSILGEWYLNQAEYEDALIQFAESLEFRQRSNDRVGEITSWQYMGKTYHRMGDYERALENFSEAIRISEETQQPASSAGIHIDIATTYEAQHRTTEALQSWQKVYDIYGSLSDFADEVKNAEAQITRLRQID